MAERQEQILDPVIRYHGQLARQIQERLGTRPTLTGRESRQRPESASKVHGLREEQRPIIQTSPPISGIAQARSYESAPSKSLTHVPGPLGGALVKLGDWRRMVRGILAVLTALVLSVILFATCTQARTAQRSNPTDPQVVQLYTAAIFYAVCVTGICVAVYVFTKTGD